MIPSRAWMVVVRSTVKASGDVVRAEISGRTNSGTGGISPCWYPGAVGTEEPVLAVAPADVAAAAGA